MMLKSIQLQTQRVWNKLKSNWNQVVAILLRWKGYIPLWSLNCLSSERIMQIYINAFHTEELHKSGLEQKGRMRNDGGDYVPLSFGLLSISSSIFKTRRKAVLTLIISLLPKSPAHPHCSLVTWKNTNACGF